MVCSRSLLMHTIRCWFILQDCVREKNPDLKHYSNYNTFATMLFNRCDILKPHAVGAKIHTHVRMDARTHTHTRARVHTRSHTHMHAYSYTCTPMHDRTQRRLCLSLQSLLLFVPPQLP